MSNEERATPAARQAAGQPDMSHFEITDATGERIYFRPTVVNAHQPTQAVAMETEGGRPVYFAVDRVEEVVAGIRDAARQAAGQQKPAAAYGDGKGRAYCLRCANAVSANVPLTIEHVDHWEVCPSCGRHVVDVAREAAGQPAGCVCGQPDTTGVVHRPGAPCYLDEATEATRARLSSPCAYCGHAYNWHTLRSGCQVTAGDAGCGCRAFVTPAAGQPEPTHARARIENLWDRAVPVGPLLDSYRAEILHEAADEALREVTTCNAGPDCGPCTTRRRVANRLRDMADEETQ